MNVKRISTGIQELDVLIEGGLRAGKPYLLVGEPGTGKTIFSLQFLYRGLVDGETVLYVAIDEKPADIIDQAASLGWSVSPFMEAKKFLILDASAYLNACATENNGTVAVQKLTGELNNRIMQLGATRVVIDPVGPLISTCDSTSRARDRARMLFYALQSNVGTTTLLTTHSVGRNVRGLEEYLVAGTIVLEMELADSRFVRTLTIEKMRSTALDPAQYLFNIIRERGIVLQPTGESLR
jgi:circadian clock protein KaiC